jgi:uncharacterized protein (DUF169 family)
MVGELALSKLKTNAKRMVEDLGLKWKPIGAKFSDSPGKFNLSTDKVSICEALYLIKNDNIAITITKENCACPGGRHFTGLEIFPIETLAPVLTTKKHRVYESMSVALSSIGKQPQPVKRGDYFALSPLEKFETDPDIVFFIVTPAEADKILGLISFKGAEPFMYYPASSICSTITNVLAKGKPEINLISTFERKEGKWSQNELIVALPFKDFEAAMENLPSSGYVK